MAHEVDKTKIFSSLINKCCEVLPRKDKINVSTLLRGKSSDYPAINYYCLSTACLAYCFHAITYPLPPWSPAGWLWQQGDRFCLGENWLWCGSCWPQRTAHQICPQHVCLKMRRKPSVRTAGAAPSATPGLIPATRKGLSTWIQGGSSMVQGQPLSP